MFSAISSRLLDATRSGTHLDGEANAGARSLAPALRDEGSVVIYYSAAPTDGAPGAGGAGGGGTDVGGAGGASGTGGAEGASGSNAQGEGIGARFLKFVRGLVVGGGAAAAAAATAGLCTLATRGGGGAQCKAAGGAAAVAAGAALEAVIPNDN